jgi:hypothetical protein
MEVWRDILGYSGKYQVSNKGNVKSVARKRTCRVNGGTIAEMKVPEKILKKWKRSCYFLVDLWNGSKRDTRSVHILIYEAFISKIKKGMMIHHKDENKLNNDVENLEMLSCQTHNRIHHGGKPSWNKGLKMSPEVHKKAWETRRLKYVKC